MPHLFSSSLWLLWSVGGKKIEGIFFLYNWPIILFFLKQPLCAPFSLNVKSLIFPSRICKKTSSSNLKGFDEKAMEGLLQPTLPSLIELDHPFSPSEEAKNFIGVDKRSKKERRPKSGGMSLSVPYHPYTVCLMCGMGQGSHGKRLQRCSHCKTATYCSR